MDYAIQPCPLCKKKDGHRPRLRGAKFAIARCDLYKSYVLAEFWQPRENDYYKAFDIEQYEGYYRSFRSRIYRQALKKYEGFFSKKGPVLDLGSGRGWFLEVAIEEGFYPAIGVDRSGLFGVVSNKGYSVIIGDISAEIPIKETFNLITMWNTLEHLSDPLKTLRWVKEHLNPGGYVLIVLPNLSGLTMTLIHAVSRCHYKLRNSILQVLYQTNTSAPHFFCLSSYGLYKLCKKAGFVPVASQGLPVVDPENILGGFKARGMKITYWEKIKAAILRLMLWIGQILGRADETLLVVKADE